MQISLGTFACICLEARFGGNLAGVVEEALRDYAGRVETGSPLLPVPRFCLEGVESEKEIELEISIASRPRRILETEARSQDVTFEQLAAHAIFLYMADSQLTQRSELSQRLVAACWRRPPRSHQATKEMVGAFWRQRR
jgi:hypothetical protein